MVWWLFKRKEVHPEHHQLKRKVSSIESTISNSFSNVKKDILHLFDKVNKHDKFLKELINKINTFEQSKELPPELLEEISEDIKKIPVSWENLTPVQQSLFKRLAILQIEGSQKWIAMKTLAEELYPNKSYNSVRSMISDYVHLLIDLGLLKKTRKQRRVYLSLSKLGLNFFSKTKQKKLLKIIQNTE